MSLFYDTLGFIFFALLPFYFAFKMEAYGSYVVRMFGYTNAEVILKYKSWKKLMKSRKISGRKYWMDARKKMLRIRLVRHILLGIIFSGISYSLYISSNVIFLPMIIVFLILAYMIFLISEIDRKFCLIPDLISFPAMLVAFLFVALKGYYIDLSSLDTVANGSALIGGIIKVTAPSVLDSVMCAIYAYILCTVLTLITYKKYPDGFGGGDLKLLIFLGALFGFTYFPYLIVISIVYFAIASIIFKMRYLPYAPFALLSLLSIFGYGILN